MSDKDRQKKDHTRTDKKNKAMREHENPRVQHANPPQQARDQSNLNTDNADQGADKRG